MILNYKCYCAIWWDMETKKLNVEVNISKQILSSEAKICKTESFFYQTKKIENIDKFILKIGESLLLIENDILSQFKNDKTINAFKVSTFDKSFSFFVMFGFQTTELQTINEKDIIFIQDDNNFDNLKFNDQRVNEYLKNHKIFNVVLEPITTIYDYCHLQKLYFVKMAEYINFPLLNLKQQQLIQIENQNVLVQGVAGSGKTNVCTNKIIWTSSRNYSGKILYTTFSRGLLIDTKNKVELFKNDIKLFIEDYKNNRIVFLDKDHKKAIENRLGLYLVSDTETNVLKMLEQVVEFLETHVDYKLLEDIYEDVFDEEVNISTEQTFLNEFLKNISNHQLKTRLDKIKNLSGSIIYKEIYGMIFGCSSSFDSGLLSLEEYKEKRKNSFSSEECEIIYSVAQLYDRFKKSQNLLDNNEISKKILEDKNKLRKYSLSIIDEVQDFTEINLKLLKELSIKMFCVGDALQMINPSYFSFAYLKKLMYDEDVTSVAELESNYRNNKKIVEILDDLSEINVKEFGTHSFVLKGKSVDQTTMTSAVYVSDNSFINRLKNQKFENFTILVNDFKQKEELRCHFKKQEILTISEIKGLERDTVLIYNVLSSNSDKWKNLYEFDINHKQADENSVYRYFFNLFYVAVSRAKHNIFVFEENDIKIFDEFFKKNFDSLDGGSAYSKFTEIISRIEIDDDEIISRINEFIKLGQFDNARFYADKFEDSFMSHQQNEKIDAYEEFVFKGRNRQAGIKLWKAGLVAEAKEQFTISGDTKLIEFLENMESRNQESLDIDVVKFFVDFNDNSDAQNLIIDVVRQDLENLKQQNKNIKNSLKQFKEKHNGK